MKKKGPQRSQSLKAFPGSSRKGFGNTTSFKLLTILDRSLFTVSQTGSVSVFGSEPNPAEAMLGRPLPEEESGGATGIGTETEGGFWLEVVDEGGGRGGRLDCMNGEEETGIEALGGLGGLAGRTVAGPDWTLALIRFSISSMSDWDDGWSGTVSPCDIFAVFSRKMFLSFCVFSRQSEGVRSELEKSGSREREREEERGCLEIGEMGISVGIREGFV